MDDKAKQITIAELQQITNLPLATLRFYETQFPRYLGVEKSSGGRREYSPENVEKFLHLKFLILEKGMSIRDVRRSLNATEDAQKMRDELDLLLKVSEELTKENEILRKSVQDLTRRVNHLEEDIRNRSKGGFRWFR